MAIVSALLSFLIGLLLVMCSFDWWDRPRMPDRLMAVAMWIYSVTLIASGWLYVLRRSKAIGGTHAFLMLGVSGLSVFAGWFLFGGSFGHHTPDAVAPVDGLVQLMGLAAFALGALAGIFGIVILRQMLKKPAKAGCCGNK